MEYMDTEGPNPIPHPSLIERIRGGGGDGDEVSQSAEAILDASSKKASKARKRAYRSGTSTKKKKRTSPNLARAAKSNQRHYKHNSRNQGASGSSPSQSSSKYGAGSHPNSPHVNVAAVQEQWERSIQLNTDFDDPMSLSDSRSFQEISVANQAKIDLKQKQVRLGSILTPTIDFSYFRSLNQEEQESAEQIYRFEVSQYEKKNRRCSRCHGVYLNDHFNSLRGKVCMSCTKVSKKFSLDNSFHPVWYNDDGDVQWTVPEVLSCLRIGEQMLIQRYSPYAPLVHIKNGTFGCKGHVCCFPQDLSEVCHKFPRLPETVNAVKMVRHYSDSSGVENTQVYSVRREKVLAALRWLGKYHREYATDDDFEIVEENFSWMGDESEKDLQGVINLEATSDRQGQDDDFTNKGVSEEQCIETEPDASAEDLEVSGVVQETPGNVTNGNDAAVINALKGASNEEGRTAGNYMDWPLTSREAVDEYRKRVFVNAFPWLYPGGRGDVNDQHCEQEIEESQWAKMQLRYFDNRFQKDYMWCFYALNFVQRHRNKKSGGFFLKDFVTDKPPTLDELKDKIRNGDTKFISQLQYFSGKLEGSDAYWRKMRAELYSWISHHVEVGNGPPTLFMTLSCAEYFWPDLLHLIQERTVMGKATTNTDSKGKDSIIRCCFFCCQ